ncbi:putative autophagy-related protein 11 [Onthophagus taurus]|uniref:putative autophagy-related protein 11 n=1 Tax=Onthophagus taurus TaxID=166361 RepID=UPI000C209B12|nr:suppressor of Mek1-like [Onthophagus taurus]
METMVKSVPEEPEEGEIIDDESDEVVEDVFEVISESSIPCSPPVLGVGKSVSHRDLLRAVSLSSISDSDSDVPSVTSDASSNHFRGSKQPRHHRKRKRSSASCKRRKLKKGYHDFDVDLKKQFQRAIQINNEVELHVNPLENRLKSMLGVNNPTDKDKKEDEDEELDKLRELALLSKEKTNENVEVTPEEENKGKEEDEELIQLRLDALKSAMIKKAAERKKRKENKENDVNNDNKEDEIKENDQPPIENWGHNTSIEEDVDIMRAMLLVSMSNKVIPKNPPINKKPPQKIIQIKPKPVKKLIINLKDSDESDSEEKNSEKDIKMEVNNTKIEEFLKTQRAAVEEKSKKDINEEKDTSGEILLDKSVVKLLPKSQQREYQMLKQKLLNAKRKKLRKTSTKLVTNNNINGNKVNNCAIQTVKSGSNGVTNGPKIDGNRTILQKTLENLHVKKSGRFQMKGKYKALGPLLQKVNQASLDRQRCEVTIKTLLGELQKARDKLHVTQQNYSNLLVKLKKAKNAIDRGAALRKTKETFETKVKVLEENKTSTPIKNVNSAKSTDKVTANGAELIEIDVSTINISAPTGNREQVNQEVEMEMEKEIKKDPEEHIKYVSPLDTNNSEQVYDPLIMYCPFELFGVCKDPECQFNHCSSKL